jgi:secondary thiamine-phosphate synthase enzyme
MVSYRELSISTKKRCHWVDITPEVNRAIGRAKILQGICLVSSLHTTGAITINENADPDVEMDFFWKLGQLVPQESAYRHSEGNSDSHVKTSLVGISVQVPVQDGHVMLGTWQSIYFCEFDGPRNRRVSVTVVGE